MTFEWKIVKRTGEEKRKIEEIAETYAQDKEHLGRAVGINIGHCVYLGMRHCKEFDRARWYCFPKIADENLLKLREEQPDSIAVDFYAEK